MSEYLERLTPEQRKLAEKYAGPAPNPAMSEAERDQRRIRARDDLREGIKSLRAKIEAYKAEAMAAQANIIPAQARGLLAEVRPAHEEAMANLLGAFRTDRLECLGRLAVRVALDLYGGDMPAAAAWLGVDEGIVAAIKRQDRALKRLSLNDLPLHLLPRIGRCTANLILDHIQERVDRGMPISLNSLVMLVPNVGRTRAHTVARFLEKRGYEVIDDLSYESPGYHD